MKLKGYIENGEIQIQEIDKKSAEELINKFHYSKTMPRINKLYIGGYIGEKLIGVMTCGWGTQPKATIKKMFHSLDTGDYWELGKFCMDEEMPHNSESNFLAKCLKHLKKYHKEIKLLYTWSDGMLGKPGYIYQSANFLYGGFIWTDSFFTEQGERIHPRSYKELLKENAKMVGKDKLFWMTAEFERFKKIQRYKGNQLRYCYFLCSKGEKKRLLKESQFDWTTNYPLKGDLKWKKRKEDLSGWELCEAPLYTKTLNAREVSRVKRLVSNKEGAVRSRHLASHSQPVQETSKIKEVGENE